MTCSDLSATYASLDNTPVVGVQGWKFYLPIESCNLPFPPSVWQPRLSFSRTLPQPKLQTCHAQGLMRAIPELFSACDLRPETLECFRADVSGVHYAALVKAVFCALGTNSHVDPLLRNQLTPMAIRIVIVNLLPFCGSLAYILVIISRAWICQQNLKPCRA